MVVELAAYPPGTLVTEAALARLFRRHPCSIRRAVRRGELPPPVRLFGTASWTAGGLIQHIEARLAAAARRVEAEQAALRTRLAEAAP